MKVVLGTADIGFGGAEVREEYEGMELAAVHTVVDLVVVVAADVVPRPWENTQTGNIHSAAGIAGDEEDRTEVGCL